MKLYTMKLYTELEILGMVPYEILMRREQEFLGRVKYVKDDPATGEPLYQILPPPEPTWWEKWIPIVVISAFGLFFIGGIVYAILAAIYEAITKGL